MENLEEGAFYEFKIAASNIAGLGLPSDPSEHFKCEAWTSPEPGMTYSVHTSLVLSLCLALFLLYPVRNKCLVRNF